MPHALPIMSAYHDTSTAAASRRQGALSWMEGRTPTLLLCCCFRSQANEDADLLTLVYTTLQPYPTLATHRSSWCSAPSASRAWTCTRRSHGAFLTRSGASGAQRGAAQRSTQRASQHAAQQLGAACHRRLVAAGVRVDCALLLPATEAARAGSRMSPDTQRPCTIKCDTVNTNARAHTTVTHTHTTTTINHNNNIKTHRQAARQPLQRQRLHLELQRLGEAAAERLAAADDDDGCGC